MKDSPSMLREAPLPLVSPTTVARYLTPAQRAAGRAWAFDHYATVRGVAVDQEGRDPLTAAVGLAGLAPNGAIADALGGGPWVLAAVAAWLAAWDGGSMPQEDLLGALLEADGCP